MSNHVKLLGILYIVYHSFGVLLGLITLIFLPGMGLVTGDPEAARVLAVVGVAGGLFLIGLAIPGLIAGIGLLKYRGWARILALVIAFLILIHFPLGTVLGVYAFWVLMRDETVRLFAGAPAA